MTKKEYSLTKNEKPNIMKKQYNFWVYIVTNPKKTVLYTGMTNNIQRRLQEHYEACERGDDHFTSKYFCYNLLWYEWHQYVNNAIAREKQIKGWLRVKKEKLITDFNPTWRFLNDDVVTMEW
jgi:putative endonuclease